MDLAFECSFNNQLYAPISLHSNIGHTNSVFVLIDYNAILSFLIALLLRAVNTHQG